MTNQLLSLAELEGIERLTRDLKAGTITLSPSEARFLVDSYYSIQGYRMAAGSQAIALSKSAEPHEVLSWLFKQMETLENQTKRALTGWIADKPSAIWAQSIVGIGPVLAAGLLAHIDITKAPTVGHIWRFAGLDPTVTWEKGQKRPWNADLKVITWKIGESFVKVSGNPNDIYGKVYIARKEEEIIRNEAGAFNEQAAHVLETKRIGKDTDAYKAYSVGKLPPAHIHARAKRYAVKLFLSHYHHVAYEVAFGVAPPKPYILNQPNHTHFISPPNWPVS